MRRDRIDDRIMVKIHLKGRREMLQSTNLLLQIVSTAARKTRWTMDNQPPPRRICDVTLLRGSRGTKVQPQERERSFEGRMRQGGLV